MASDSLDYISKDHVKKLLTHINMSTQNIRANVSTAFTKEKLTRANVRRFHYAFLHPSDDVPIKALKYGFLIYKRLTVQVVHLYRLIYGTCPYYLAGKTINPSQGVSSFGDDAR